MARKPTSLPSRALLRFTNSPAPHPRKIYELVVSGVISATYENGQWYFDDEQIPEIAALLGLPMAAGKVPA